MSAPAVVVTGAVAGIGRAIAQRLLASGWAVVAVDLDGDGLAAMERVQGAAPAARGIAAAPPAALATVAGDVTDPATLERAATVAEERFGRLDAWVNNAGIPTEGPFEQETLERLDRTLAVNLRAPLLGCQVAVRAFLASGTAGAIVNVSSIHARAGFPGWIAYDAAKGGIEALTRSVCVEFGPHGIRCNAVAPGAVLTAATSRVLAAAEDRETLQRQWRELSPMGVVLSPDDVAAAVAYLLSPDARFVSGHVLAVDAGMAARCVAQPPPR